jgi:putative membrane protein insertion efficiency factor
VRLLRALLLWPLIRLVRLYQKLLRPILPPACRYYPSCSDYALQALQLHGPLRGSALAVGRICRCHPYHEGGFDPVPAAPDLQAQQSGAPPRT